MSEKEKLRKLSSGTSLGWLDDARFIEENEEMLAMSAKVAMAILKVMKQQKLSNRALAQKLGISPQSVGKQLSGNANFTFETLQKYGKALGMKFDIVPRVNGRALLEEDYPSTSVYTFKTSIQSYPMRYDYVKENVYSYDMLS